MAAYYRGRTEAFSTKISLSIGAVMGCCSLCDELTNRAQCVENNLQPIETPKTLSEIYLKEKPIQSQFTL